MGEYDLTAFEIALNGLSDRIDEINDKLTVILDERSAWNKMEEKKPEISVVKTESRFVLVRQNNKFFVARFVYNSVSHMYFWNPAFSSKAIMARETDEWRDVD